MPLVLPVLYAAITNGVIIVVLVMSGYIIMAVKWASVLKSVIQVKE